MNFRLLPSLMPDQTEVLIHLSPTEARAPGRAQHDVSGLELHMLSNVCRAVGQMWCRCVQFQRNRWPPHPHKGNQEMKSFSRCWRWTVQHCPVTLDWSGAVFFLKHVFGMCPAHVITSSCWKIHGCPWEGCCKGSRCCSKTRPAGRIRATTSSHLAPWKVAKMIIFISKHLWAGHRCNWMFALMQRPETWIPQVFIQIL